MSVRNTTKLNRHDLKYLLLDSLKLYSENVAFQEGINPYGVNVNGVTYHVLIRNVHESGDNRLNPDECRLQLSRSKEIHELQIRDQLTITLGYFADENVFTAWNPFLLASRFNLKKTVSVYSRFSIQKSAGITGIDQYIDKNGQSVISFKPEYLGLYLENFATIHDLSLIDLRDLIVQSDILQDESQQVEFSIQRQKYTVTHTRYKRSVHFRAMVYNAYNFTCAMCGIQLSLVEAAHIVPHSHFNGTDEINNGICLCPLHHKAYDSSLVYFVGNYTIKINKDKAEYLKKTGRAGGIEKLRELNLLKLQLPANQLYLPLKENIVLANRLRGIT